MIKLAICDDDVKELEKTKEMCKAYQTLHPENDIRISIFISPSEMLSHIDNNGPFDLVLLDIYMPGMTGIILARTLREKNLKISNNDNLQIIFLTTSQAHAVEAFSLHAAHYLVKPFKTEQLDDALSKAIYAIEKNNKAYITLKTAEGVQRVYFADYIYSETDGHIQKIYRSSDDYIKIRITCCELYKLLSFDNRFFKYGCSYLLNLDKIQAISKKSILFENGMQITMQRRQYKELLDRYTSYSLEVI